jgi:hypothetical protein
MDGGYNLMSDSSSSSLLGGGEEQLSYQGLMYSPDMGGYEMDVDLSRSQHFVLPPEKEDEQERVVLQKSAEDIVQKNWVERMHMCYNMRDDRARLEEMSLLTKDFNFIARLYAEVIISEKDLPIAEKTIKPAVLGGVAGGEKYIAGNVLFKFAEDYYFGANTFL